jgi:hypothetical protein
VTIDRDTLGEFAELLAEKLDEQRVARSRWVTAEAVADYLAVEVGYVYEHAAELGARRLGDGPRARLRFRFELVDAALCVPGRESEAPQTGTATRERGRRRRAAVGTGAPLLPIRGARGGR